MALSIKTSIECTFESLEATKSAKIALTHEGNISDRSSSKIIEKGKTLTIDIKAKDVVALRASANAYLRALAVFEGIEAL